MALAFDVSELPGPVNWSQADVSGVPGIPHPTVSIVIPALNEARNLPYVLPRIPPWIHEVVLVDGHSTDGTLETARMLWPNNHIATIERRNTLVASQLRNPERRTRGTVLRLVTQDGQGKGAALRSGFAAATGEILVMLDADGSMDPGEAPLYVAALLSGAHFAKGSRFLQGGGTVDMPYYRRWGNQVFVRLVRMLFGGRYSDLCYGYCAFWSWAIASLQLNGTGFEIETMMNVRALQAGLKIAEVPSFEAKRVYGIGQLQTIPDGWRVVKTIFRERLFPVPELSALAAKAATRRAGAGSGLQTLPTPYAVRPEPVAVPVAGSLDSRT